MSTIIASRRPVDPTVREGTEGEAPGFVEGIGLQIGLMHDDQQWKEDQLREEGYRDLKQALVDFGVDPATLEPPRRTTPMYGVNTAGDFQRGRFDLLWKRIEEARARKPDAFKALPKTQDEYEAWLLSRKGQRQQDQQRFARAPTGTGLIGGVIGAQADPVNLFSNFISGGGKTILQVAVREAAINAGVEAVQQPGIAARRAERGEDFSLTESGANVLFAGIGGGIIGGAVKGGEIALPKLGAAIGDRIDPVRAKMETAIANNWDRLPETVRTRWAKGATIGDADLPDLAEALIGRGNMSVDERAMVDGLRREAEIAAASPFKPGMAGDNSHRVKLDDALSTLLQPVQRQARPFALPVRPDAAPTRGELRSGTSLSSGSGPRAALKSKIRGVESGGNDAAKNSRSSATGRYQFTSGTWLSYYKRRFGAQGLSDAEILAKRGDGTLQETLMDDLTADNAAFLRGIGEAESAGNLYLTHFAGTGGARKLFGADPDAAARDVLGAGVVKANPWMEGMTAGDVIAWAHKKMDEAAPRRAGARTELADDGRAYDDALQAELDRIDAESDAAAAARASDDPMGEALADVGRVLPSTDNELVPVDVGAVAAAPLREAVPAGLTDREIALLPALRSEIGGTARLSDLPALAKRLEATEAEVRRGLERIAATEKALIVQGKDGRFRRAARDRAPVDAHKFLARAGGLADAEGHELIERFGVDARTARTDDVTGGRVAGARRQSKIVPGAGPLVRNSGIAIDRAGEMLFEGGYLRGADGGRPTVAETIAYLERGMEGPDALRTMVPEDRLGEVDAFVAPATLDDMRVHMGEWAQHQAVDLTADDVDALARIMAGNDALGEDAALAALVDRKILDALDDARYESGDYDDALARYLDAVEPDSSGQRFAADAGDAGEGGGRSAAGEDWPEPVRVDSYPGWDDPAGSVAAEQADSIIHDIEARPDLFGGATRDEARQALERQGDGALNNGVAQKPAGSDGGLFDTAARSQTEFALDENGDMRSWADIADELDADEAEIKAIRDCL